MFTLGNGGQLAFFEIAATVIPVLLFGGVLAERGGPTANDGPDKVGYFAMGVPIIGAMAVLGELLSIAAILIGPPPGFFVAIVAVVLVGGFVGVILAVWLPWMMRYRKDRPRRASRLAAACTCLLVVVFISTVYLIVGAVGAADSFERIEARLDAQQTCEEGEQRFPGAPGQERPRRRNCSESGTAGSRKSRRCPRTPGASGSRRKAPNGYRAARTSPSKRTGTAEGG